MDPIKDTNPDTVEKNKMTIGLHRLQYNLQNIFQHGLHHRGDSLILIIPDFRFIFSMQKLLPHSTILRHIVTRPVQLTGGYFVQLCMSLHGDDEQNSDAISLFFRISTYNEAFRGSCVFVVFNQSDWGVEHQASFRVVPKVEKKRFGLKRFIDHQSLDHGNLISNNRLAVGVNFKSTDFLS